jgi:hypothetical protein
MFREIDYNNLWSYDIEVTPVVHNTGASIFFSAVFIREGNRVVFEISDRIDQTDELLSFISNRWLAGYNNHGYDDRVLQYLKELHYGDKFLNLEDKLKKLKSYSDYCIRNKEKERVELSNCTIDLMTLTYQYKAQKSLKMVGILLGHNIISESPISFETGLGMEDKDRDVVYDSIIKYNINDVIITDMLLSQSYGKLRLRQDTGRMYNIDINSSYDSEIAKILFTNEYKKRSGIDPTNLRTFRTECIVYDLVPDSIKFTDIPEYVELLEQLKKWKFNFAKYEDDIQEIIVKTKSLSHTIAGGGIHSNNEPQLYKSNEEELLDVDYDSYYPMIMLNFKFCPAHLDSNIFFGILKDLTYERIHFKSELKRLSRLEKTKEVQEAIENADINASRRKIIINAIYGLTNSDSFFLYDPMVTLQVCITGQLMLIYMAWKLEKLYKSTTCIYTNTDGLMVTTSQKKDVSTWIENFARSFNFTVEFTDMKWAAIRDVNNYVMMTQSGKLKRKGTFEYNIRLLSGYDMPIIGMAVEKYLVDSIPIEETIYNCNDIRLFTQSKKFDKNAKVYSYEYINQQLIEKELNLTNRWYITKSNCKVLKKDLYKGRERVTDLSSKFRARVILDIDPDVPISKYNINYSYYISEAKKLVTPFKKELKLW